MLSHPRCSKAYHNKFNVTLFLAFYTAYMYTLFRIEFCYPCSLLFQIWYQELSTHNIDSNFKDNYTDDEDIPFSIKWSKMAKKREGGAISEDSFIGTTQTRILMVSP